VLADDGRNIGFGKSIVAYVWQNFSGQLGRKNSAAGAKFSASYAN
jgi:hypothetical protein